MATPRETLFQRLGIKTADEIRADRNERQQAFLRAQQDPFAKSGAAIGVGLKRLFGKPSEEEVRAQKAEDIITDVMSSYNAGGDDAPTLGQTYQGIMQRLGAAGFGEEAMNMGQILNEYNKNQIDVTRQQQVDDTKFLKTFNQQEVVVVDTVDEYGSPVQVPKIINATYQYDVRNPDGTKVRLSESAPAPNTAGGGTGADGGRSPVDLATRRQLRNGGEVAQGADGQFYTIIRGADGKAYQGQLVANPSFAPTAQEQEIIDKRNAQPIIQIGPKVTKEERGRRAEALPSTAADDQLNPFSLF